MDLLIKHDHSKYANQTLFWLAMDAENRYNTNLRENFALLNHYNWIDKVIEYKFNSLGFRSMEFDHSPNVVFIGCSETQGIGIRQEDRWTELVASSLNLSCFNLAIGGASADTAFRLLYAYIDKLRPKLVIFRQPGGIRMELNYKNDFLVLMANSPDLPKTVHDYFLEYYALNDLNHELNSIKNKNAIENLCIKHNAKFVYTTTCLPVDLARDLAHPGIISNQKYAESVLSLI